MYIAEFRKVLYRNKTKCDQDAFLLKYMEITCPKKHKVNPENVKHPKSVAIKYLIKTTAKSMYICAKSFQSVTGNQIFVCCVIRFLLTKGILQASLEIDLLE